MFDLDLLKRLNDEASRREVKRMLDQLEGWASPEALSFLRDDLPEEHRRLVRLVGRMARQLVVRKEVV